MTSEKRREYARRYRQSEKGRAKHAEYQRRHQPETNAKNRVSQRHIMSRYGMTLAQRAEMVRRQSGACAICNVVPDKLHVDHDHATGRVRGLLCRKCNTAIGMLHDSPTTARLAADYLEDSDVST